MPALEFNIAKEISELLGLIEDHRARAAAAFPIFKRAQKIEEEYNSALRRLQDPRNFSDPNRAKEELEHQEVSTRWDYAYKQATKALPFTDEFESKLRRFILCLPMDPWWQSCGADLANFLNWTCLIPESDREIVQLRLEEMLRRAEKMKTPTEKRRALIRRVEIPPGTQWKNIEIRFTSEHQFQIFFKNEAYQPLNYQESGFADARGGDRTKPIAAWGILLLLARGKGTLSVADTSAEEKGKIQKAVQEIKTNFKTIFGIPESPIQRIREEYRSAFKISASKSRFFDEL